MPNSDWPVAAVGGAGPLRPRRRALDGERDDAGGLGSGGHTSSTIWMSAPSSSWVATADSGVRRWVEPS